MLKAHSTLNTGVMTEFSFGISEINDILKYINRKHFLIVVIFHNITVLTVFWSNKYSLGEFNWTITSTFPLAMCFSLSLSAPVLTRYSSPVLLLPTFSPMSPYSSHLDLCLFPLLSLHVSSWLRSINSPVRYAGRGQWPCHSWDGSAEH